MTLINKPRARRPYLGKSYVPRHVRSHTEHMADIHERIHFGLRSVKELAKVHSCVSRYRKTLMNLRITNPVQAQKLTRLLLQKGYLQQGQDPLSLGIESLLNRRLQTVVAKGLNISVHESRQLIVQGHVRILGRRERSPSFSAKPGLKISVSHVREKRVVEIEELKVTNSSETEDNQ